MKQLLLIPLLLGAASPARAQLSTLLSTGLRVGVTAAVASRSAASARNYVELADPRAPTPDVNVTQGTYRGQAYPQKRTPPGKRNAPGGESIAWQENALQQCQAALLADSTAPLGTAETWARLQTSRETIARERPTWNVPAYREEAAFYQAETARRQRPVPPAAAP